MTGRSGSSCRASSASTCTRFATRSREGDRAVVDPRTGSRLPGGFRGVVAALAEYGYKTVELAGYDQGANGPIAPAEIRALLEEHGLRAVATQVDLGRLVDPDVRQRELDRALAVGAECVGTPGGPGGGGVAAWQAAAERLNTIGAAAVECGLGFFHRTRHAGFDFFPDPTPDLAGVRRYQAFLDWTNPRAVSLELDVFSAYVARHRYPPDADGSLFDPVAHVAAQPHRYPLFHLQDAIRVETDDGYT